jgi:hypothetical protein
MRGCESSNREMLNDFDFDFDLEETEEMGKTWIATSSERKQRMCKPEKCGVPCGVPTCET